mmetsp:Transcript_42394/g.137026  ORF Transcript_42394/g.137026 Transcript_42394/m.137026 type:complete len:733 (-) Transcript_42394:184-2382(-)
MKFSRAATVCLGLFAVAPAAGTGISARAGAGLSPITRVVELLNSIAADVEKESKAEEDLYDTFVCWATTIISQKSKSNAAGQARSDELSTYISDLDNGRIELTSERTDLTTEIEELSSDIEVATQMREKEKKDYEDAKDEMEKAIDALTQAVEVLRTATEGHAEGVLLATHSGLHTGFEARASQAAALARAVGLGEKVLTKGDASFLRRLLTGEVPVVDWKKMNRKATFKMDYKVRSFKIQDVLAKLLENFASDLKEANEKEAKAVALYDTLMESKNAEKSSAQDALAKMEKETSARGMSREESASELDALTTQIKNDETYIEQVQKALAEKKQEWKDRKELRTGELAAISQAISILHSDDARDLVKKSLASQEGFLFIEEGSSAVAQQRMASVVGTLRTAAGLGRDRRLAALATRVEGMKGHFGEVLKSIDSMLKVLQDEEAEDLKKKEHCDADRAADTREAIVTSRAMDELSDGITVDRAKVAEIVAEIKDMRAKIAGNTGELKEAKDIREQEHKEYVVAEEEDSQAVIVVNGARSVLEKFYRDNGLALAQRSAVGASGAIGRRGPFQSEAGEAPPPPPPTFEAPYGGKTDESTGIIGMLEMIAEDIQKDSTKAKAEEEESGKQYKNTKESLETENKELGESITVLEGVKGEKEGAVGDNTLDRHAKRRELGVVMTRIADSAKGCDYFAINYSLRVKNRQIEVDGLIKAKTILSGGAASFLQATRRLRGA